MAKLKPSYYDGPFNMEQLVGETVKRYIGFTSPWGLFCAGNIMKYIFRAPLKNGIEDLRKAQTYLEMLLEETE